MSNLTLLEEILLIGFLAFGLTCIAIVVGCFVSVWRAEIRKARELREAKAIAAAMLEEKARKLASVPKGKIIKVGEVKELGHGAIMADEWQVIYPGNPYSFVDGIPLWCGYSAAELREIAARKAEFEP